MTRLYALELLLVPTPSVRLRPTIGFAYTRTCFFDDAKRLFNESWLAEQVDVLLAGS